MSDQFSRPSSAGPEGQAAQRPGEPGHADEAPRLHIDSDWKAQAQAEKERLTQLEKEREKERPRGGPDDLPPAEFKTLVGVLATQAVMSLGGYQDQSGRAIVDLGGAKFMIDLLDVLAEKTKNNLEKDEAEELKNTTSQLRARFVQLANIVARQMAAQPEGGAADLGAAASTKLRPGGPGIVQP